MSSFGSVKLRILTTCLLSLIVALSTASAGAVVDWERKDSDTGCDEIGWNVRANEFDDLDEEELEKRIACVNGVAYVASCGTTTGSEYFQPSANQTWVLCYIVAMNLTESEKSVSMFDFSLVTDTGRKFDTDFSAMLAFDASDMFPTETLRDGQSVAGMIGFSIPKSSTLPLTLEIDQLLNFSVFSQSDVGVIVIPKLFKFGN